VFNLDIDGVSSPPVIRHKFVFNSVIDDRGTLDFIGAQLMSNFLRNGMTISAVARQMGITRSTVYARLRKYNLLVPDDDDKVRLQPTVSDLYLSGFTFGGLQVVR